MSLHIQCSAKYFKVGSRVIDKITEEYDPPCYWFRLKILAKGAAHKKCIGHITKLWRSNGRLVKGFDPLVMLWVNEPPVTQQRAENITQEHYRVDIAPGNYELAGLIHVKLPSSERNPNLVIPPNNKSPEQMAEVELNKSRNEDEYTSKLFKFPYGIYYVEVACADDAGHNTKEIFKVWGFPNSKLCSIRTTRFYERINLFLKSFLPAA